MKSSPLWFASISLVLELLQTVAHSQTTQRVTSRSAIDATFAAYEKGAHTGPAESALVTIQVTGTNPNGTPITPRFGNGLVLRCDGFIAIPFDLYNLTSDSTPSTPSKLSIHVTINPGTEA